MSQGKSSLTIEDNTEAFLNGIKALALASVKVGIPEQKDDRKNNEDEGIGNAALLYINNFGSPANNIPARPVMDIGIRNAKDEIAAEFRKAVQAGITGGADAVNQCMNRAGIIGANAVKKAINDQLNIEGPADSTLRSRQSKGFAGTKALLVTGQMRNAITYVVGD